MSEEKKETKKLEEFKDSEENKKVVAETEGKIEPRTTRTDADTKKKFKKDDKKKDDVKVELEREYVVPLRRGFLNVPKYKRAKKAIRVLKEFMVRHMSVRDGDLKKVKIDGYLNNEIWFRGIKNPLGKVKVRAKKIDGIVYVELAELPDVVKFVKARDDKKKAKAASQSNRKRATSDAKKKEVEEVVDKDKDGVDDKVEEKEDKKSGVEKEMKLEKAVSKEMRHTAQGKHLNKTMPVRKALKK